MQLRGSTVGLSKARRRLSIALRANRHRAEKQAAAVAVVIGGLIIFNSLTR